MPKDSLACLEALPPPLLCLIAARVPSPTRLALAGVSTRLRRALAGDMACELWTKPELPECVSPSLLRAVATTAGSRGRGLVELSVPIPRGFDPQQALLEELFVCVAAQPNATTLRRVCLVQPSDSADNEDEERLLVDGEDVLKLLSLVSPTCVVVVDGVLTTSPEEEALSLLRAAPRLSVRHLHIEGWCTSLPPAPAVDAAPVLALAASVASTSLESLSLFGAPLNFPASLRALLVRAFRSLAVTGSLLLPLTCVTAACSRDPPCFHITRLVRRKPVERRQPAVAHDVSRGGAPQAPAAVPVVAARGPPALHRRGFARVWRLSWRQPHHASGAGGRWAVVRANARHRAACQPGAPSIVAAPVARTECSRRSPRAGGGRSQGAWHDSWPHVFVFG